MSPLSPAAGDGEAGRLGRWGKRVWSAVRRLRRLPERILHPFRRRRARERLRERRPEGPVLFVCHGNICRSPYAELAFRRRVRGRIETGSAGLMGPDRPPPDTALQVAAERGVDLSGHRSRLVSTSGLRRAGLVLVMEPYQSSALARMHGFRRALVLGDLDPEPVRRRAIRDPVFQQAQVFQEVYGRIDRCVEELVRVLGVGMPCAPGEAGSEGGDAHGP